MGRASPETRMLFLHDAENRMTVSSLVWTKHRNVTDEWTDRIPLASFRGLHSEQCGRAVKIRQRPCFLEAVTVNLHETVCYIAVVF